MFSVTVHSKSCLPKKGSRKRAKDFFEVRPVFGIPEGFIFFHHTSAHPVGSSVHGRRRWDRGLVWLHCLCYRVLQRSTRCLLSVSRVDGVVVSGQGKAIQNEMFITISPIIRGEFCFTCNLTFDRQHTDRRADTARLFSAGLYSVFRNWQQHTFMVQPFVLKQK